MKTRNEQPSFKQKTDSKLQNKKAESRLQNCSLDNCSKESRGMKGDMKTDSSLSNCTRKNQ